MSVGRNDPCPCGSGKKFKKCHGAEPAGAAASAPAGRGAGAGGAATRAPAPPRPKNVVLGLGRYAEMAYLDRCPPGDPLLRIENGVARAEAHERAGRLAEALAELAALEAVAESLPQEKLFAFLGDYETVCAGHPEAAARGLALADRLLAMSEDRETRAHLLADRAEFLHYIGRSADALRATEDLLENHLDLAVVRARGARLLVLQGRTDHAIAAYRSVMEMGRSASREALSQAYAELYDLLVAIDRPQEAHALRAEALVQGFLEGVFE